MTVEQLTNRLQERANNLPSMGVVLKMNFKDEGIIHLDSTGAQTIVTNEDKAADCTISMSLETFDKLRKGELNPMMAVMTGKIKIDGDMSVAMKLQSLLQ